MCIRDSLYSGEDTLIEKYGLDYINVCLLYTSASNYSYDTWVIGFVMIGMAYFVGNCQEEGVVSTKDTVIMVIAFAIAIIPKQIYLAFLIIPFLMKRNKIENKKKYYSICSMAFVIMLFDLLLKTIFETSKGGDVRRCV